MIRPLKPGQIEGTVPPALGIRQPIKPNSAQTRGKQQIKLDLPMVDEKSIECLMLSGKTKRILPLINIKQNLAGSPQKTKQEIA